MREVVMLSPHFSLHEFTHSATAEGLGIPNDPDENQLTELKILAERVEIVREVWKKPLFATNALRSNAVNVAVGGAPNSAHKEGKAGDFADADRSFARFCLQNLELLEEAGLWMEDPRWTPTWVHLQTREVPGHRVFIPSSAPPLASPLPEQRV